MMNAPCVDCPNSCFWFTGQFIPFTCGITQYCLRRKVLENDMTKYTCCQGYLDCCCFKSGQCCEQTCPDCCLCIEAHCCNGFAVSASRMYVMEKYDLSSDPCDYRLIRINNFLQALACVCHILALINDAFKAIADIVDRIADIFYHCVSGCMTAQVAHEMNYQLATKGPSTENPYAQETHSPVKATPIN